jgi:single-stranded-DNA-specific exonuclease
MKWLVGQSITSKTPANRRSEIIRAVLTARGLTTQPAVDEFLKPPNPLTFEPETVGINVAGLEMAVSRINQALAGDQPILIYGDYDADGVTATGILWETLHAIGAKVYPFIPSRELHGYGLSLKGLTDALKNYCPPFTAHCPLVITVDNGITAHEPARYLEKRGIDLIITDHHQPGTPAPACYALVHTNQLSGAGIAWIFAKELISHRGLGKPEVEKILTGTLDLAAIGTIADLMPLTGPNRGLAKFGLEVLAKTQRPGLLALFEEAGLDPQSLSAYHISYVIAPRLNAMGRLKHALDSLRLLLTQNPERARTLALELGTTNKERQDLTLQFIEQAKLMVGENKEPILIIDHKNFHEGVIGLVAGKLVESYYRPAIVISRHQEVSKGSARSIKGVNIIDLIRSHSDLLVNAGGHPMAAGFTIETGKINSFRLKLLEHAQTAIDKKLFSPSLNIDCQIEFSDITTELYNRLEDLKPFGIGNPKPIFAAENLKLVDLRTVGADNQHLKLLVQNNQGTTFPAIGFGLGGKIGDLINQTTVSLAFNLEENTWNHHRTLQLHVKDIK